ncbi:MAG: hypothetical protein JSS00_08085 [Proteobacteria bacterium]|nr:hypothetical protein [Pseudomonadota bacterium]
MTYHYSFKDCLARAERITWRVEDLIGGDKTLDFSKPFLPESLARVSGLAFLNADEKRTLNQIRGHAYLSIFGLVEEFILPFVLDQARGGIHGDEYRERALLEFASEEGKHIHLFRRFREEFAAGFGVDCEVIGPPEAVARHVLSHPILSVALLTLHIEWMVQRHFQESVQEDASLDAQFKNLLLHHWMEELQHAQLDTLMVEAMVKEMSPADIEAGVAGYVALGSFLDEGLQQQTQFDLAAFEKATSRSLNSDQRARLLEVQHQANRWTYIGSGMSHPKFLETLGQISADGRRMIEQATPSYS